MNFQELSKPLVDFQTQTNTGIEIWQLMQSKGSKGRKSKSDYARSVKKVSKSLIVWLGST